MNCAESLVPASICMACWSVEGACTLSEAPVVGLYQYIFVSSFPKRTMHLMFPMLRALNRSVPRTSTRRRYQKFEFHGHEDRIKVQYQRRTARALLAASSAAVRFLV